MKLKYLICLLMLVIFLAACSSNGASNDTSNSSNPDEEVVELTWTMWADNQSEAQVWEDMANEVSDIYPNIKVDLTTMSFGDYWTRIQTQVAGDNAPDIISMQSMRMPGFGSILLSLDELAENDDDLDLEDFDENIIENMRYNDELSALPYDVGSYVMYYNKDLFDKHGVDYPKPGWTWDEFTETLEALSSEGDYGMVTHNSYMEYYLPYIYSHGGEYLENGKYKVNGEETIATMEKIASFVENKQAPELVPQSSGNWQAEQWLNGNIGLLLDGPWNILWFLDEAEFDYGVVPVPEADNGSVTISAGSGFGISNATEHPEEAYKVIKHFTSKESLNTLAEKGRAYPARVSAIDSYYTSVPEEFKASLDYASEHTVPFELTDTWSRAQDIFTGSLVPIMNGEISAEEGMNQMQSELENIEN